jgi:hypothetical protein
LVATLAFAGLMSGSTAYAKACPAICKAEIKACKQLCTTPPKAKCKRACKKDIVDACKASGKTSCVVGSPSGAFVD